MDPKSTEAKLITEGVFKKGGVNPPPTDKRPPPPAPQAQPVTQQTKPSE